MFANALNWMIVWWTNTLAAERSFIGVDVGTRYPPLDREAINKTHQNYFDRDIAWAAMVESLKDSSPAMLANSDGLSRRSTESERSEAPCAIPPGRDRSGWRCTHKAGHDGPCAVHPPWHFGDPCIYCGAPHDDVPPGPCRPMRRGDA